MSWIPDIHPVSGAVRDMSGGYGRKVTLSATYFTL
jgi:hypothetical protein